MKRSADSIFNKLLLTSALLTGVTLACADFLLTRYTADRERSQVQRQMAQSLRVIVYLRGLRILPKNSPATDGAGKRPTRALDARVTVVDGGGVVLADSRHDPETMENHAARPGRCRRALWRDALKPPSARNALLISISITMPYRWILQRTPARRDPPGDSL